MTDIDCRYGKGSGFELTKACLAGPAPEPSSALNFTRHFARVQVDGKVRSKQGERLPSTSSPQYSRSHDAAWKMLQEKGKQGSGNDHGKNSKSHAETGRHTQTSAAPPETPAPQVPEWSVALMSGALAIGVAIVAGLALSGGIKSKHSLPHLGVAASGRLADGPIVNAAPIVPASLPVPASASLPAVAAIEEKAVVPEQTEQLAPPAAAYTPPTEEAPPLKKKKHKKTKVAKTGKPVRSKSRTNPFTGDQPAYSASLPSGTLAKVTQCHRIANIIRHELCMWQACKNKWGRDGCPSYNNAAASGQIAGIRH